VRKSCSGYRPRLPPRGAPAYVQRVPADLPLAAVLAGGASRRFGSPKALAPVDGVPLIRRVVDALARVVPDPVLITATPELFPGEALRSRPDAVPGGGALAGVHAALLWAVEEERPGALVVACDMPFLSVGLLREIVRRAGETRAPAVVPEGAGPAGIEPLCAWYGPAALPEIEARLRGADLSLAGALAALGAERLSREAVRRHGDPDEIFLNVNTRESLLLAERIARRRKERDDQR